MSFPNYIYTEYWITIVAPFNVIEMIGLDSHRNTI